MADSAAIMSGMNKWKLWIDRGGTFTDIIGQDDHGEIKSLKILSLSPHYKDAIYEGITRFLTQFAGGGKPQEWLHDVRIGTTIGTNALLERKGEKVLLAITEGLQDLPRIRYQNRPDIFARDIEAPPVLFTEVMEVRERILSDGEVETALDEELLGFQLQLFFDQGFRSIAICLMNSYLNDKHERTIAEMAKQAGFSHISISADSPLKKIVRRCDTTVVDAYITPLLQSYLRELESSLPGVPLSFMQSHGGLCPPAQFRGPTSLLSGPAGGLVGAVKACEKNGLKHIVTFDMGGTSTDVSLYKGELPIKFESSIEGIPLRIPMLDIYTVAAGGGSVLRYDGASFKVGPESAGAFPGPACYRNGGPLTVTDANLYLGRIKADEFPAIFGPEQNLPPDVDACRTLFEELAQKLGRSATSVAQAFLNVATENMAAAIRKVSTNRGTDLSQYALCSFGGAGAQVACLVADRLGIEKIYIHPLASLLSAFGIGNADLSLILEQSLSLAWSPENMDEVRRSFSSLESKLRAESPVSPQGQILKRVHLKIKGSDFPLAVDFKDYAQSLAQFRQSIQQIYGFETTGEVYADSISLQYLEKSELSTLPPHSPTSAKSVSTAYCFHSIDKKQEGRIYRKADLPATSKLQGPALIQEQHTFITLDEGWQAQMTQEGGWILERSRSHRSQALRDSKTASPEYIEIFNRRFMTIAEEMGEVLQKTSQSINIKERLDYSCAVFSKTGDLLANAPHMPVHLGSMGESVKQLIAQHSDLIAEGHVIATNSPYDGGTHIPDITVISPVFDRSGLIFFIAARGHHADIGGKSPGSMPSDSQTIAEEGILFNYELIVEKAGFRNQYVTDLLSQKPYPARNIQQNLGDLKAQVAANKKGSALLLDMVGEFGNEVCQDYVQHVLDYGSLCVQRVIDQVKEGKFELSMDNGAKICIRIQRAKNKDLILNFEGTSAQLNNNFNAPYAVTRAAAAYVFRCLVTEDIPLNEGCFRHLDIKIPEGCFLNPRSPAAVVAGNVESSQAVVDALFLALGEMAASQGTMNNLSFGTDKYQYYETICGGTGAGPGFSGSSGIHSHMTNSRLTDPEVLEERYPVRLRQFSLRKGSGGRGQYSGGDGVVRSLEFAESMSISLLTERRQGDSPGLRGGAPGKRGENWLHRGAISSILPSCYKDEVHKGDWLSLETPGGGAYGQAIGDNQEELYFAFGSNMWVEQMAARCPSSYPLGRFVLNDHRLAFSAYSPERQGGVANTLFEKGSKVWGVLYSLSHEDLLKLDAFESTPRVYKRVELEVSDESASRRAWSYQISSPESDIPPHPYYWYLLYRAAYRFNFPKSYIKALEKWRFFQA